MKYIAIFSDLDQTVSVDGYELRQLGTRDIKNFLESRENFEEKFFKEGIQWPKTKCIVLDLALGEERGEYINFGLCLALIAHAERIPMVIYSGKNTLHEETIKILSGVIKKVIKKQVIEVRNGDFSEVLASIKEILEPSTSVS